MGYHRAGFEVVGVDIKPQPHYPFEFHQADALTFPLDGFDAVHASPPCQAYSELNHIHKRAYPELIDPIRRRLVAVGVPYVIENVRGAPLIDPIMLCGTMFRGLRVYRHRIFEAGFPVAQPSHVKHDRLCHTLDKRKRQYGKTSEWRDFVTVTGGGNSTVAAAADAMGIDWMPIKRELNEAIPPAYTQYIGEALVSALEMDRAA